MKEKRKIMILSEIGKFLIDVAKLVLGGVIITGIMQENSINRWILYSIGSGVIALCFISGLVFCSLAVKKED